MGFTALAFTVFEILLFVLPALPETLRTRLAIVGTYTIGHFLGAQTAYLRLRRKTIRRK